MNWWVVVPVGWTVLALVLGLFIGRGIRMAGTVQPECPLPRELTTGVPAVPGDTTEPAASPARDAGDAGSPTGDLPHRGRIRTGSLLAAG